VDGVNKPKLWFYLPVDYWHNVEPLPTSFWTEEVDVIALPKADGIGSQLPAARGNIAISGRCRSVRWVWISLRINQPERGDRLPALLSGLQNRLRAGLHA
jgi:Xaa-Pro dipeptidase